ncbi:MAG: T9SS C-terminal target domain-containing protein [Bacteroidetes bacterium]|nr:MAG: T9SS C-terminal target domain-containing protein [Bacteroidota bacterium]
MLISPVFDLSDKGSASLTFDYAYRLRRQQAFPADRLRVELSTDCGESYPIMLLDRYAEALATTDGFEEQQPFIPAGPDDWASVSLDLSPYTQRSGLRIRFVNIGGGGQQLYLDNIHLSTTVDLPSQLGASLRLLPNPFEEQAYLQLRLPRPMSLRLSLYNLHGRQLWQSEQWQAGAGMQQYSLPLSLTRQLPGGMYLLRIQAGKTQLQTKLLKQ